MAFETRLPPGRHVVEVRDCCTDARTLLARKNDVVVPDDGVVVIEFRLPE